MKIDDKLLQNLEKLSSLKISDDKREEIKTQLTDILEYVNSLNELDTSNVDSYFSTIEGGTPLREDIVEINREIPKDILSHAPDAKDDFFIVPAIIE